MGQLLYSPHADSHTLKANDSCAKKGDDAFLDCAFCDHQIEWDHIPTPSEQASGYERMAKHIRSKHVGRSR